MASDYLYQSGLGNTFQTESLPGPPKGKQPSKSVFYGLYAEQLSVLLLPPPKGKLILLVLSN